MIRIGIFYDGNFFFHVSNYYQYHHERRQRLSVGGLHAFLRSEVGRLEDSDSRYCPIAEAHYFRGRLRASDADDRDLLFRERVFDDVLVREGVTAHYMSMSREGDKGVDVPMALEAYELASMDRFDVAVLVACDGDYLSLVRKLIGRGIRVMVLGWDFRYQDANGYERETRTAQVLIEEATYPVDMVQTIDDRNRRNESIINGLFVPRREFVAPPMGEGGFPPPLPVDRSSQTPMPAGMLQDITSTATDVQGIEMVGVVSAIKNGYGFITPAIGGENIFFFHADVQGKDFLELKLGEKVEYISTVNERGPCARNVRVVG
jgi:cold shock CspA family protein